MFTNHTVPYSTVVFDVHIEVSHKDRGFLTLNISQDVISILHECRVECAGAVA